MNTKLLASSLSINNNTIYDRLWKINTLADVVNAIIPFVVSLSGIILLFVLIWGGVDVMTAQGSAEKVKAGRSKITSGIIGYILLLLSYFAARLLAYIFGLDQNIL